MNNIIDYQSNLKFLNHMIDSAKTSYSFNIEKDIFLDKIVDDIFFIENSLNVILYSLKNKPYYISQKNDYDYLIKINNNFSSLLKFIMNDKYPISEYLQFFFLKFEEIINNNSHKNKEIKNIVANIYEDVSEGKEHISKQEYEFLLIPNS